jgi:hypothetical protein
MKVFPLLAHFKTQILIEKKSGKSMLAGILNLNKTRTLCIKSKTKILRKKWQV